MVHGDRNRISSRESGHGYKQCESPPPMKHHEGAGLERVAITKKDLRRAAGFHPSLKNSHQDPRNVPLYRVTEGGAVLSDRNDVMDPFKWLFYFVSNFVI